MRSGYLDFFKEKLRNRRVFVDTSIILCYKIHKKTIEAQSRKVNRRKRLSGRAEERRGCRSETFTDF